MNINNGCAKYLGDRLLATDSNSFEWDIIQNRFELTLWYPNEGASAYILNFLEVIVDQVGFKSQNRFKSTYFFEIIEKIIVNSFTKCQLIQNYFFLLEFLVKRCLYCFWRDRTAENSHSDCIERNLLLSIQSCNLWNSILLGWYLRLIDFKCVFF